MNIDKLKEMKAKLDSDRDLYRSVWESCLFYFLPQRQSESMDRANSRVAEDTQPLDTTGQKSAEIFTSGIYSSTVTMGSEFFGFRTNNEELNKNDNVKAWFSTASKECLRYMQNSNYQMMSYEALQYYSTLETGVLYTGWEGNGLFYQSFPITQCSISEDKDGIVNTMFRSFMMTPQQAYEKWGDDNSKEMLEAYADPQKRFVQYPFYHACMPREAKKVKSDALVGEDMAYASYYVDEQNSHIIEEGGYKSFPYAVPRYLRDSTSPYGRGSAFSALPLTRQLDECRADLMDARQHKLQPTVFLPVGSTQADVDMRPNAVNFFNAQQGVPVFYNPDVDINAGQQEQLNTQQEVRDLFFVNLFTAMSQADAKMTATQVNAIKSEKAQGLAPVINRLYDEFFSPSISRTLELLMDNGALSAPPEELQGQEWTVEYTTRLSALLDQIEVNSTLETVNQAFNLYAMEVENPKIGDVIDLDQLVRDMWVASNSNMEVIRSEEETEEIRANRAEAQAQQQQAEQASQMIAPIDASSAPEQGSPLQQMVDQGLV
jgi:hypothetical protein